MKRRILLEVDVDDSERGAMLKVLNRIMSLLEELQQGPNLVKFGLDLLTKDRLGAAWYKVPIETMEAPEE